LVALVDDVSVTLGAPHPTRIQLPAVDRKLLTQAVLHVETGLRLRLYPRASIAMLKPDGQLIHAERDPAELGVARSLLARHVTTVERGRGRKQRQAPDAVQAWSALISGNWGLVEREERGIGRYYAVVETSRLCRLRALTELETHAVELTARGLPGKTVGYALGVSSTRVSKLLASAAIKLGFGHRTQLVQVVAGLLASGPKLPDESALSKSERDVLSLVRLGFSNAKIAEERQRSERTVANQVASILKKLDAPSRRALAVSRLARL
jgi:DNA-binding NarL/FixJ family response regulator